MSLISRLGKRFREKPKSTNLNLPSLPTSREILDDIEACPNSDPIITLATIIQKKGRQSLMDSDLLKDLSASANQQSQLAFLSPYQTTGLTDKSLEDIHHPSRPANVKGKASQHSASKLKITDADQINSYNKLKQFLLLYEKSDELIEDLEPHFKRIETVLKACDEYSSSDVMSEENAHEKESEIDVCSSPLM